MKAIVCSVLAAAAAASPAHAQVAPASGFPSRAITLTVALAAGGAADIIGRAVAQRLNEMWGQPVVVENKGGANTQVATAQFIRAEPDGHSLLVTAEHTFTVNPALYDRLAYDPEKDFTPVSGLIAISQALALHPSVPAKSIAELVALARSKPMTYGSLGVGSGPHLSMVMFQSMTGLKAEPVQYRGGGPAMADLIAGHIPMLFIAAALVIDPWRAGKLATLGIGSPARLPGLPDLPAIDETLPGFRARVWFGLFAPGGTPRAIVEKINGAVQRIMSEPAFRDRFLAPNYFEPMTGTPDEFSALIRQDAEAWRRVIAAAGLKIKG